MDPARPDWCAGATTATTPRRRRSAPEWAVQPGGGGLGNRPKSSGAVRMAAAPCGRVPPSRGGQVARFRDVVVDLRVGRAGQQSRGGAEEGDEHQPDRHPHRVSRAGRPYARMMTALGSETAGIGPWPNRLGVVTGRSRARLPVGRPERRVVMMAGGRDRAWPVSRAIPWIQWLASRVSGSTPGIGGGSYRWPVRPDQCRHGRDHRSPGQHPPRISNRHRPRPGSNLRSTTSATPSATTLLPVTDGIGVGSAVGIRSRPIAGSWGRRSHRRRCPLTLRAGVHPRPAGVTVVGWAGFGGRGAGEPAQPQAVADDEDRAECHGSTGDQGVEQAQAAREARRRCRRRPKTGFLMVFRADRDSRMASAAVRRSPRDQVNRMPRWPRRCRCPLPAPDRPPHQGGGVVDAAADHNDSALGDCSVLRR